MQPMQPMQPTVHLETTTRQGQLLITEEMVMLRPRAAKHRAALTFPRARITGASSYRAGIGRTMVLHVSDGSTLRLDEVPARDALAVVALLGYARMLLPQSERAGWERKAFATRQGRLQVTSDTVLLRSRINPFAKPHWQAPRTQVTGISSRRAPGTRMGHEVRLHTTDGEVLNLGSLSPDRTIALTRTLGHIAALPEVPEIVVESRAALWDDARRTTGAAPEADDIGYSRPTLRQLSSRRTTHMKVRELHLSTRVASLVTVALLGAYLAAAILGGRSFAYAAPFLPTNASSAPSVQPSDLFIVPATSPAQTTSKAHPTHKKKKTTTHHR